jgi:hypothetical protein
MSRDYVFVTIYYGNWFTTGAGKGPFWWNDMDGALVTLTESSYFDDSAAALPPPVVAPLSAAACAACGPHAHASASALPSTQPTGLAPTLHSPRPQARGQNFPAGRQTPPATNWRLILG